MSDHDCEYCLPANLSANYDLECGKQAKFRLTTVSEGRGTLFYYACDREHANLLKADLWGIGVDTTSIELIPS